MINVLIVDDHQLLRAGLELIFETVSDITVIGTAVDGEDGLDQVHQLQPDLVITDIRMPKLDGISLIKQLHDESPELSIVVLTTFDDQQPIQQAMQLGARGFLLKDADKETILNVVRGAMNGETYIEPRIASKAFSATPAPATTIDLSPREHQILTEVAEGYHSKEIASDIGVSERTVKSHLTSIYNKLGVFSRAEAVAKALQLHLIDLTN
ncbi:chemotaxis protein CheY [Secundilactobacillus odoratitofui DSM 19909 = JCM 15043]|uniref:Chemotaxis protein CheY n=1 Tax=Secundilactobacillus odoratitofui DSM 19909 = JCM 15043 TaxID=1423776 RepID=A0A0R1M1S5_9LACO|nr:response regulator transcription factor [Secundilactobacillus odoratitofui]KRK98538.1 chemotaxis protein CheY [Secundilactobacillus odoratitofui DSM 19909 = JCM 15043]